jgi:hypothetical protein
MQHSCCGRPNPSACCLLLTRRACCMLLLQASCVAASAPWPVPGSAPSADGPGAAAGSSPVRLQVGGEPPGGAQLPCSCRRLTQQGNGA